MGIEIGIGIEMTEEVSKTLRGLVYIAPYLYASLSQ